MTTLACTLIKSVRDSPGQPENPLNVCVNQLSARHARPTHLEASAAGDRRLHLPHPMYTATLVAKIEGCSPRHRCSLATALAVSKTREHGSRHDGPRSRVLKRTTQRARIDISHCLPCSVQNKHASNQTLCPTLCDSIVECLHIE